jgi:hypothetical protein
MVGHLEKEHDNKKAREGFIEAARTLELTDIKELHGLAETMFKVGFLIVEHDSIGRTRFNR